jgi:hypothetical protein
MKIRPVGAELLREDRRTVGLKDTSNLIASFRNFSNAPKNHLPMISRYLQVIQFVVAALLLSIKESNEVTTAEELCK